MYLFCCTVCPECPSLSNVLGTIGQSLSLPSINHSKEHWRKRTSKMGKGMDLFYFVFDFQSSIFITLECQLEIFREVIIANEKET